MGAAALALGGLGQLLNSFGIGNNTGEWNQNALIALWNRAQQGDAAAMDMFRSFADPARQRALDVGDPLSRLTIDQAPYTFGANQDFANSIPGLMQQFQQGAFNPQMQGLNDQSQGAANRTGGTSDIAAQLFAGGGWTPQNDQLYSMLAPYLAGQGNNSQLALGDVGSNLLGQRGQTAYTQAMQDRATDAANSRGINPDLQFGIDRAKDTLATGGYNDQTSQQSQAGMNLFGQAAGKALGNTLMSPQEAANWGREDATNNIMGQQEQVYRQANQRGGAPGSIIAGGSRNQMLADFADQSARLQTDSARKAFQGQEGLQLQDKGIASGLAGVGANLAQGAEGAASQRTGQALGAIPGMNNSATSFLSSMLGAGGDAGNQEVSRMNAGTGMSQALLGSQNAAQGQWNAAMGNQNQYALGGGQLANSGSASQANIFNQMMQNLFGAGALGNQTAQTQFGAQNSANSNTNNAWQNIAGAGQAAINPLTNLAGQSLGYAGQYVNLMGAPFSRLQGPTSQPGLDYGGIGATLGGLIDRRNGNG